MPTFKNRDEYERWKTEKMQQGPHPLPIASDIPEVEKKKTGLYILLAVLLVVFISVFIYRQFFPKVTWTDTSYTNWKLDFSMNIPEGWETYDFAFGEKATLKMQMPSEGEILFTVAPENRKDIAYTLVYLNTEKLGAIDDRLNRVMKSLASAMSSQNYKVERFEETIAGTDTPFIRGIRGEEVFIVGAFLLPEKLFMPEFHDLSGEYEEEFWTSIESFRLIEE